MCAIDPPKPSLVSFRAFGIPFSEKWLGDGGREDGGRGVRGGHGVASIIRGTDTIRE